MGTLDTLAAYAVTKVGLQGINWNALNAKGRGSIWNRDYITDYMLPAMAQMTTTVGFLDVPLGDTDPKNYRQMYSQSQVELSSIAGEFEGLGGSVGPMVMMSVQLSRTAIQYLVSYVYQASMYGVALHNDETIQHSGKSDAEIAAHASSVVGMMNALVLLDRLKVYSTLDLDLRTAPAQPASGLGLAPVVVVAITVVAVAALALIAWIIVNLKDVTQTNAIVATMCTNAQASGDAAITQQCVNTLTAKTRAIGTTIPDTLNAAIKAVLPYALAGVGVYMLFLIAPSVIKSIVAKKFATA